MGYYWITQAQRYIQSLGFKNVNNRQQLLRINQYGGDNSFYRNGTSKLTITLGKGGVDDAEDAEVIVHEYGHSVQDDQVPNFGSSPDAGAIGEAFGDYLAVTVTQPYTPTVAVAVRRRLGLDLLHAHDAALPAPHRRHQAVPGRPRRRGPRRRRDLVLGAVPDEHRPSAATGRQDHHRRAVRLHPDDLDAAPPPQVTVDYARKTDPKAVPAVQGGLRRPQHRAPRNASSDGAHAPLQREDGHGRGRKRS